MDDSAKRKRDKHDAKGFKVPKPVLKRSKVDDSPPAAATPKAAAAAAGDAPGGPGGGVPGRDAVMDDASPQKASKGPKLPKVYTDECTAFVSNIAFTVRRLLLHRHSSSLKS